MRDVFISHSSGGDEFAMTVLETVKDGLAARKFTPLVDQHGIPPGNEWRPEIVDWLARCHCAVFLVNEKALESDWVRREVNILLWRKALGSPLAVVPVLLGDLSTSAVKAAGLEELRPFQFARTPRGAQHDALSIANKVLERFAELPPLLDRNDPMAAWLDTLSEYLGEARHSGRLVRAATALKLKEKHLPQLNGGCLFLAHQFLVAPPDRMEHAVDEVAPSLSTDSLKKLIACLEPTWVDAEAARGVLPGAESQQGDDLPAAEPQPQDMTVLLNARKLNTAELYIRRATCCATRGYQMKSVGGRMPTGEDQIGEQFREWEGFVWQEFFDAEDEEDRILPSDLHQRVHYLIINARKAPTADFAESVRLLHGQFSWLVVVVTTGTELPDDRVQAAFKKPTVLKPLLNHQDEIDANQRNQRLRELPDRLVGRY
ncbi:toll/interleukin-1 receptor domain-containing protein [Streptomyces sp. NPDC059256]|uniref:toll/interleukin-1 receptor domain-containing protein n=1 Tax=Streptomyces sp. NPDC059256 TaxID=3346794 RepID=UPI0036C31691